MSESNAEIIRRHYAARAAGDNETFFETFAADPHLYIPGNSQVSGHYRGLEELKEFYAKGKELTAGNYRPVIIDILEGERFVAVILEVHGEREGRKLEGSKQVGLFEIVEGKIVEVSFYAQDVEELDRFWS